MKTNQLFSLKRFCNYTTSSLILRYRQILLMIGAASAGLLLSLFFFMSINDNWNNEWVPFSIFSVSAASLLYIGSAFPALRSREKTINFLMIPASPFEKFLYEFIERIVLFCVLFPILLYLFGNLALGIVHEIKQSIGDNFPSEYLSYQKIFKDVVPADAVSIIVLGVLAAFSIAFAGTIVFRKLPLIKTIIFVGVVFLVVVGYCILIFEEMKLNFPWIEPFFRGKSKAEVFSLFAVLLLIFNLIILSYAFFKLKEKEVS